MSASGTYNFGAPKSQQLIDDAYERIGVLPSLITPQQIQSAQSSLNFILQEWVNRGNNLWTVKQGVIGLYPNQAAYPLPLGGIDVKTATLRTSTRLLGGTPFSTPGGIASLAFDGNPQTACVQSGPNGFISYNWGVAQNVTAMVGIQSSVTADYTLSVDYSFSTVTNPPSPSWINAITIPKQTYVQNILQWYPLTIPLASNQMRIMETGGATLSIAELYFNNTLQDIQMSPFSESEYTSFPNKQLVGRPSGYWVDRQIKPVMYIYPVSNGIYNAMYFTYWKAIEDAGTMLDTAQIPARFLEALTAALAHKLAIKLARELQLSDTTIDRLGGLADASYHIAGSEDRERVPARFYANPGWGRRGY